VVGLLEEKGPHLPYPYSSDIKGTKDRAIRELRIQHKGRPYRILYAFDPRRAAILPQFLVKSAGCCQDEHFSVSTFHFVEKNGAG
jgi:hypothetical protein